MNDTIELPRHDGRRVEQLRQKLAEYEDRLQRSNALRLQYKYTVLEALLHRRTVIREDMKVSVDAECDDWPFDEDAFEDAWLVIADYVETGGKNTTKPFGGKNTTSFRP